MLNHPTIDRLRDLGLVGMIHALEEQQRQPDSTQLTFEDRLAMLVDREVLERDNKRLKTRLRFAGLRQMASVGGGEIPRIDGDVGGFEDRPSAARLPSCSRPSRTRGAASRWPCGHP